MMRVFALGLGVMVLAWAGPAVAGVLKVDNVDGKVVVQVDAPALAAWRPAADQLVVVTGPGSVEAAMLPAGWSAEKVNGEGLTGVVIKGGAGQGWKVVQDGDKWLLREGTSTSRDASALLLRGQWRVEGDTVKPHTINLQGTNWDVGLLSQPLSVAGSVVGVVRRSGGAAAIAPAAGEVETEPAAAEAPQAKPDKKIEPVAVETPKPVEQPLAPEPVKAPAVEQVATPAVVPVAKPEAFAATPAKLADVMANSGAVTDVTAAALPAGPSGMLRKPEPLVPLLPTTPLQPVKLPVAQRETLPRDLNDIYVPGTLVSLSIPEGVGLTHPVTTTAVLPPEPKVVAEEHADVPVPAVAAETEKSAPEVPAMLVAGSEVKRPAIAANDDALYGRFLPAVEGTYSDGLSDALQNVVEPPEGSERWRAAEINLAGFYLAWQRPEEALAVLAVLPRRADGLPANALARLYHGIAKLARGSAPELNVFDQAGPLASHAKLWKAVAAAETEDYGGALKMWPKERGILPQYPDYLRELAQKAQLTALVMVGDKEMAVKTVDALVEAYPVSTSVPPALVRLQGLARLGTKDEAAGLDFLAKAADNTRDPGTAYRAKYEFVKALQQRHDLSDLQVRKYLTDLWFDWRGDGLERDVLRTLADLYDKANEPREALRYWQILVTAYPHAPELNAVTDRMTEAFVKVFDPENAKTYDPLTYLGLYYDFSELAPADDRGDAVQEQVGKILSDATLWARAVPVLEQQLQYRQLDPAAQGRLALLLAEDYRRLGKGGEALRVLDKWQKVATTTALARGWKIEEARLLLDLSRPDAAKRALAKLPEDDAEVRDLRIEADWKAKNWQAVVPNLQAKLAGVPNSGVTKDTGAQLALFQLAYAYGQMRDGDGLDKLVRRYGDVLPKLPQLADGLGAVAAGTGLSATIVTAGPLAPMTQSLVSLNQLTDRLTQLRNDIARTRAEQKDYDDKMKYMDLLPPPVM